MLRVFIGLGSARCLPSQGHFLLGPALVGVTGQSEREFVVAELQLEGEGGCDCGPDPGEEPEGGREGGAVLPHVVGDDEGG